MGPEYMKNFSDKSYKPDNLFSPDFDINATRRFLKDKQDRIRAKNLTLLAQARKDFDKIVKMLIKKYRPRRIYQWGSLLNENDFSEISDIDIAIEGDYSAEEFFRIYGDAMELTGFPLDLLEINKIEPLYAMGIRKKGRIVYER